MSSLRERAATAWLRAPVAARVLIVPALLAAVITVSGFALWWADILEFGVHAFVEFALGFLLALTLFLLSGVEKRLDAMARRARSLGLRDSSASMAPTDPLASVARELESAEARLRSQAERLNLAVRAAQIDIVEFDLDRGVVRSSERIRTGSHVGFETDTDVSIDNWILRLHPDDRPAFRQALGAAAPGAECRIEFRLQAGENGWRWMEMRGRPARKSVDETAPPVHSLDLPDALSGSVVGTIMDVTSRRLLHEQLRSALEDSARASRAKSEFLSQMSHELRTPLNAVLGFAQLLDLDTLSPSQKENVAQVLKAGRHLLGLINEILDLARVEAGEMTLAPKAINVASLMDEVITMMRPIAADFDVELSAARPPADLCVLADNRRLKQVLINLISNAIKYNRRGGTVRLESAARGGSVSIIVSDTGQGIPREKLGRLFRAFDRLGAEHGAIEGTGLGLALSHRLVGAMGGTIQVESEAGRGSAFTVEMPVAFFSESNKIKEVRRSEAPFALASALHVLYVEDNEANIKLVEAIVSHHPRAVLTVCTRGGAAIEEARALHPDLILLDLNLPDVSGKAVLEALKQDPRTASIPVIILSADATTTQTETLLRLGARQYMTKPIDVAALLALLDAEAREPRIAHAS